MKASKYFHGNEQITTMVLRQHDVSPHKHDFLELVYVTDGSAWHYLDGKKTEVKKGDYFIIDLNTYHHYKEIDNFNIINTLFKPEAIDKALYNCKNFRDVLSHYLIRFKYEFLYINPTNYIFKDENGEIFDIICKIIKEFNEKKAGYIELMRCHLIEIIIRTMRAVSRDDITDVDDHIKFIVDYIEENYMYPLTLTDLSKTLNFSLPYLSKRFKEKMNGMTFNEYLQRTRIMQSCRLLLNTDKKISEIAELVGYEDIKFFGSIFKKHINLSPRNFRSLHKDQ